jgi:uncharacterized protein (TIGR02284 family)
MEKNEEVISKLNELVEINNDRIQGYTKASQETEDSDLIDLFNTMATHSRNMRSELAKEILQLGGVPTESTKNSGKIFRIWMDIKVALTVKDREAVLNSCEFGEDAALETYEHVLKSDIDLPTSIRELAIKQKNELKHDHDSIKQLRDSVKARK